MKGFDEVKVYISGPMSGLPDYNFPAFFAAAEAIRQQGHEPVNPADGAPEGWTWEQYMRRAMMLLLTADAVYVLPGWECSRGARLECVMAHELKMPVRYLDRLEEVENVEACDACGKILDQLKGEDVYDEPSGSVYCEEHWLGAMWRGVSE